MSSSTNMSSVVDGLNYRHMGRTYSTVPFNIVKNVKILKPVDDGLWTHLVFALDKKYLRNNAIAFNEFEKTNGGQAMFKCFSFFVQMVYTLQD